MSHLAESYQQQTQHVHKQNQRTRHQSESLTQPKRRLITRGEKLIWTLGMVAVLILAITVVSRQAAIYSVNRDINHLQEQVGAQSKVNDQLNVKVTQLLAPDRIRRIAENQLGLKLNEKNVKVLPH